MKLTLNNKEEIELTEREEKIYDEAENVCIVIEIKISTLIFLILSIIFFFINN